MILPQETPADDMLCGAAAIAEFLKMPARKIYRLRSQPDWPIKKVKGFGLVASRKALAKHIEAMAQAN